MKRLALLFLTLIATQLFANPALFTKYETVRQGLLKNSLQDVRKSAAKLSADATKAKQAEIAKAAGAVAKSDDLKKAREAFGVLSDEMIKLRASTTGDRPAVAYCPMAKKSWLQSKSLAIANPYEPTMKECGMWKKD